MNYIDVYWHHRFESEPVRLVSELDSDRYETRKLEFFRNGLVCHAMVDDSTGDTMLGETPIPSLSHLNQSQEFSAMEITAEMFECLWQQHLDNP